MKTLAAILSLVMVLIWTPPIWAYDDWDRTPTQVDALIVRPMGVVATIFGAAMFLATLPFTLMSGGTEEAANAMVVAPYQFTVDRPLGYPTTSNMDRSW
jgi:hypothetical protein